MKRGMSGRTRRGSPPLPRQRRALRVVQLTFLGVAVVLALLALDGWSKQRDAGSGSSLTPASGASTAEIVALGGGAVLSLAAAAAMGVRLVRGPRPPEPD